MENPVVEGVINIISTEFSTGVIITPFRHSTAAMDAAMELHYLIISNAIQSKKTSKTAPF